MASCLYWVSYSNLSDCNSGAGEDLMSCYVYLHTFLHNLSWCLVFLEMLRPWLKCQINSVGLHRAWLAQHAFHIKNAPHGVEEDGSWFSLSPCRVFFSEACDTTARPSVEFPKTRNDDSRCVVVFQSPSWGTAAPPPPIACTPSCTSTPAPSRSPHSAGPTASSVAPWAPSWQCHATAVGWVRLTHLHIRTHTEGSE